MYNNFGNLVVLIWVATVLGENCDKHGVLLYEDLGCTADQPADGKCPEKFNCNLVSSNSTCLFGGKIYENRETVDSDIATLSCNAACVCNAENRRVGSSKFTCAILDCPEWLGRHPPPGCYRKYSLNRCCSTGHLCPRTDNVAKCDFEGKTYNEGERFWPQDSCLVCVCQKGFDGRLEAPFCRRQKCGAQISRTRSRYVEEQCAPIYSSTSKLCCPDHWTCPDGTEKIEGEATSDDVCQYGDKQIKKGQTFEKTNVETLFGTALPKIKCECTLPPLLKCHPV